MASKITADTVMHVAKIAKLRLTAKEAKKYQKDMNEILKAFSALKSVKTERIKPSFHPLDVKNVLRKDEIEKCMPREEAMKNTKHKDKGFFKGPKAV